MNSTEIVIQVADRQCAVALLVDGRVSRRTVLDQWPALAVWARRIRRELGADIHARLRNIRTDGLGATLALARYLDHEGFTVGIEGNRHCPEPSPGLQ